MACVGWTIDSGGRAPAWLAPEELVRRFLLHVLPRGFMRIRHYGFLANAIKRRRLRQIRRQLPREPEASTQLMVVQPGEDTSGVRCPHCGDQRVQHCGELSRQIMAQLDSS